MSFEFFFPFFLLLLYFFPPFFSLSSSLTSTFLYFSKFSFLSCGRHRSIFSSLYWYLLLFSSFILIHFLFQQHVSLFPYFLSSFSSLSPNLWFFSSLSSCLCIFLFYSPKLSCSIEATCARAHLLTLLLNILLCKYFLPPWMFFCFKSYPAVESKNTPRNVFIDSLLAFLLSTVIVISTCHFVMPAFISFSLNEN